MLVEGVLARMVLMLVVQVVMVLVKVQVHKVMPQLVLLTEVMAVVGLVRVTPWVERSLGSPSGPLGWVGK